MNHSNSLLVVDSSATSARSLTFCKRLLILLLRHVEVVDVGGVMLAVVQLHDLRVDVWLQGAIVVRQVRKRVLLSVRLLHGLTQTSSAPETHTVTHSFGSLLGYGVI